MQILQSKIGAVRDCLREYDRQQKARREAGLIDERDVERINRSNDCNQIAWRPWFANLLRELTWRAWRSAR